jgi:hypothetical protein
MKITTLPFLGIFLLMLACSPQTKLAQSWADPSFNAATSKPFTKVLVIAPLKNATSQRIAEDKIVSRLKQGTGVQSYIYLQPSDTVEAALESKLKQDGFDGIILMHLKSVEKSTTYTPGTSYGGYYGGYGGYHGYGYGGYRGGYYGGGYYGAGYYNSGYTEGHYSEDRNYYVETNLYSLSEKKLLWAGTTISKNPDTLDKTLDQIIAAIRNSLQKKGYIKE